MTAFWFAVVVLAWVLFFVLEGFDFGVGVLAPLVGRDDHERGAALGTVGPFWDGNEVWLVAAIGVTFAAFPPWYAALLAGLYLPMVALLLLLAVRGTALEFRGKNASPRWRRTCETALAVSSAGIAALWGAILTVLARGLALGPGGEVTGTGARRSLDPVLTAPAALGALLGVAAAVLLGATFLTLRTTGPVRVRARRVAIGTALLLTAALGAATAITSRNEFLAGAVLTLGIAMLARQDREATAFLGTATGVAGAVVTLFVTPLPVVLPSTLNPAWSLTTAGASATPEALRLLTVVGLVVLPGVLVYQAFSYWVFRRRVASERIPT